MYDVRCTMYNLQFTMYNVLLMRTKNRYYLFKKERTNYEKDVEQS